MPSIAKLVPGAATVFFACQNYIVEVLSQFKHATAFKKTCPRIVASIFPAKFK